LGRRSIHCLSISIQNGAANCCKFNRWGTLVAVGSTDGRIFIFDFVTKGIVKTWTAHALPVSSLSWSRDGRKLLTASADTTVAIWNVIEASCMHRNDNQVLVLQLNYPPCLDELNPRSQRIITNDIPGAIEDGVSAIAFDRRANYLITGTNKGKLVVYDAKTLKMVSWGRQNSVQQIKQIVIPRRGNFIITNSQDRIIRTFDLNDILDCYYICGASTKAHSLYVWERTTGTLIKILHGTKGECLMDVQWHPIRPVILSVANGIVSVWTQAHVENWSAFAPEFTELEENAKYEEKEGEFDLDDEDADVDDKGHSQDSDEEIIDIESLKPSEILCSSDEEDNINSLLPDVTLKTGPLWFLPITPECDNTDTLPLPGGHFTGISLE
uniref:WD_REPEATS_REGION domain-containing protein n=1 Tax=Angiostrongylus costaricensis TaxID=334426 RepID=A0A158PG97_ANGCS